MKDGIYRWGEEPLCGMGFLGQYDQERSHEAMHRRSEVVAKAAIETSRRGDGRFIDGEGVIEALAKALEADDGTVTGGSAHTYRVLPDGRVK